MTSFVVALHVTVCILLILIVLLQTGKGAEMGASIGGAGSQALFGAAGPANILTKITTAVAIIFMITSLSLAYMSGHQSQTSVMKATSQPVEQTTE
ncbi:MAG: preprotein translocase subunit SecG [Desulfobacter sp.]|nr:preprotein translocase subunit SecG [Desulfobacter sp.]